MDSQSAQFGMSAAATRAHDRASGGAPTGESPAFGAAAPKVELPKGEGANRGISEKFATNPVTGTGLISVPIATSPGRSSIGPQLSLSYDSGACSGPFGFGWSLSLPAITRKTNKGLPHYLDAVDSDVFILSGAEDLVPALIQNAQGNGSKMTVDIHGAPRHRMGSCEFDQDDGIIQSELACNANLGVRPMRHPETASNGFPSRS